MKNVLFTFVFLWFSTFVFAQKLELSNPTQKVLAVLEVKALQQDGTDTTNDALSDGNRLYFYTSKETKTVLLSNLWEKQNSQSFGVITHLTQRSYIDSESHDSVDEYRFKWHYENSYDAVKGVSDVVLTVSYASNGGTFNFKCYTDHDETIFCQGVFSGTLDIVKKNLSKK